MSVIDRWKITIEYNGAPFCGWQRQREQPSVQEHIENALFKFCQQNITLTVAGRTDTGVHARAQIAHFDIERKNNDQPHHAETILNAVNFHLRPAPIALIAAEHVSMDFHARFGAKEKTYMYRVLTRVPPPVLDQSQIWHLRRPLDIAATQHAIKDFLGKHDFSAFRASECQAKSPIRTINAAWIETHPYDHQGGIEVQYYFQGQAFLHHQVRNMVGTLVEIGQGRRPADDIPRIIASRRRDQAGMTCPPDGLYLMSIDYL